MHMTTEKQNGYTVVSLRGAMDVENVAVLKEDFTALTEQVEQGVVVEMSGVTFLDSSGIGALVFMYKRLQARQCKLHLVGLVNQPLKLVRLLRIDKTIASHEQLDDVIALNSANPVLEG